MAGMKRLVILPGLALLALSTIPLGGCISFTREAPARTVTTTTTTTRVAVPDTSTTTVRRTTTY